ncbi:Protein of unknown function [Gryllus bimaculatus]|nr:Protein of unknown function [Gryllus bimaculatus]
MVDMSGQSSAAFGRVTGSGFRNDYFATDEKGECKIATKPATETLVSAGRHSRIADHWWEIGKANVQCSVMVDDENQSQLFLL